MDLKTMTDGELAALMIAAGNEMERRRAGKNVPSRLKEVLSSAADSGITEAAIDKALATIRTRTGTPKP